MMDIVVLAGTTPWSVLSLCKCASLHKVKAYVVCVKNGWGRRYAKSRYVYKAYDTSEEELDSFWSRFFNDNSFDQKPILYVTSDYVCQLVERDRPYYEGKFNLCVASSYILNSFIDKNLAAKEAEKHGLIVPKTQEIQSEKDVDSVCREFSFPVIVKPVTFSDHSQAGFKTQICKTDHQLRSFVIKYFGKGINLQCQEFIQGEDKDCVFYQFFRDKEGQITECMGEKTMQTDGIMTIGTTKYDKHLAEMCQAFLRRINYVGIGGVEFKNYNGKYYFIEMSTRTEGFLPISDMAGVSLADASFSSMNGGPFLLLKQKESIQYVVFEPLVRTSLKQGKLKQFFKVLFSPRARFVGAYLDLCFALKLDLRII